MRQDLKNIYFTETARPSDCLDLMTAGAKTSVLKATPTDALPAMIERVLSWRNYVFPELLPAMIHTRETRQQKQKQLASIALSSRETKVENAPLNCALKREIAAKLKISFTTVKFYMN